MGRPVGTASHSPVMWSPATETRRDFLYLATGSVAAFGLLSIAWPLIDQMKPDAATLAQGEPVDVDLSKLEPGQQITIMWRGRPVFVVYRTPAALGTLQAPGEIARLADPHSEQHQQPDYARNWHRSIKPPYLILVGICTHLGCIPSYRPQPASVETTWPGGYLCPCHGSKYDLAGRVYTGVPAPLNLSVPPYRYVSDAAFCALAVGPIPPSAATPVSMVEARSAAKVRRARFGHGFGDWNIGYTPKSERLERRLPANRPADRRWEGENLAIHCCNSCH